MGNRHTLNPQIPIINLQEWEEISVNSSDQAIYGDFRSLQKINGNEYQDQDNENRVSEAIDQYELFFSDEDDYKLYLQAFIWRLKQPNIVRTRYLKQQHSQQFCSKTYSAKVYIQNIKTRLSDITDIPFPENLYVAYCAFEGYHKLYDHLHYFKIEQSQICVDAQGEVRVWLNSDLSKNYPNMEHEQLSSDETHMVQQILAILDQNTDKQSEPTSLIRFYEKFYDMNTTKNNGRIGFEDAKLILEQYVRQHNVQMPTCFESIMQIYRNQDGIEAGQQQIDSNHQLFRDNDSSLRNNKLLQQSRRTSQQGYARSIQLNGVNQAISYPLNSFQPRYQTVNSQYVNPAAAQSFIPQQSQNQNVTRVPHLYKNGRLQSHQQQYISPLNINPTPKPSSMDSRQYNQSNISPSFAPSLRQWQNHQVNPTHIQYHQQMFNGPFNQPRNQYHTSQHIFTIPLPQRQNTIHVQQRNPMHVNSVPKPISALAPQNYYGNVSNNSFVHRNYHLPRQPFNSFESRKNIIVTQKQGKSFNEQKTSLIHQINQRNQIGQKNFLTNLQNQGINQQDNQEIQENNQSFNPPSPHSNVNRYAQDNSIIRENPAQLLNSSSPSQHKTQGFMEISSGRKIISAVSPSQSQLNSHARAQTQVLSSNSYHSHSYATQNNNNQIQRVNSNEMHLFNGNSGAVKKSSLAEYQQQIYNQTGFRIGNSSVMRNSVASGANESQHSYARQGTKQKAQYYTLETTQGLDPQIAQDLKRFYSFE